MLLTEIFIDDMDASLRQIGIGDYVVGKHVGRMMGALGGRLTPSATALAERGDFEAAVRRNVFHDAPPSDAALALRRARGCERSRGRSTRQPLSDAAGGEAAAAMSDARIQPPGAHRHARRGAAAR